MRAALRPESQQAARQDQAENKKRRHDERGERVQDQNLVPLAGLEGKCQGAEREHGREQQDDRQTAKTKQQRRFAPSAHRIAFASEPSSCGTTRNWESGEVAGSKKPSGHSAQRGLLLRHQFFPVFTIKAWNSLRSCASRGRAASNSARTCS